MRKEAIAQCSKMLEHIGIIIVRNSQKKDIVERQGLFSTKATLTGG